uniref:FAS1 domain-containing protein n=1 Tax=Oryza punctata TaxID=4537 RepID=A0A0E0M986_ORYPU
MPWVRLGTVQPTAARHLALPYFTVFAVADDAILAGGAADYVWGFRFHIVPGRRLTHADLLHLHPGTVLPTLAGDGYNLLVTHGADDDVFVNHVGIKEAEVVTTERLVVHGVHSSLLGASASKLNLDQLWSGDASASGNAMADATNDLVVSKVQTTPVATTRWTAPAPVAARSSFLWTIGAASAALLIPLAFCGLRRTTFRWFKALPSVEGQELKKYHVCDSCTDDAVKWVTSCCQMCLCSECFCDVFLTRHRPGLSRRPCRADGAVGIVNEAGTVKFENSNFYLSSDMVMPAEQRARSAVYTPPKIRLRMFTSLTDLHARESPRRKLKVQVTEPNGRRHLWRPFHPKKKPYPRSFLSFLPFSL